MAAGKRKQDTQPAARKGVKQTGAPNPSSAKRGAKHSAQAGINAQVIQHVLFEQASNAIAIINESHQVVNANASFASLLGYTPQEVLNLYQWDWDAGQTSRETFLAWWQEMQLTPTRIETRFRCKNGSALDVEVNYTPAEWEGERVLFLVCRDITKSKQVEASLQASQLRFELASWATKDVIWERDLLSGEIIWNESLRKIFRFPIGEINPTIEWWQDHIHPDDRAKVLKSFQAALEQGQDFWSKEYRFRLADDSYADIFDRGYILSNGQGRPIQMIGAMMDITYRKESEEKLDSERNLLSTVIDNLPDSVFVKDVNSRLILDNIAHRRLLGATRHEEVVGRTDFDFFPRELAEAYIADEKRILEYGEPMLNQEEPVVDSNGDQRWLLTTKVPLRDRQGAIVGIVGINHDITNRIRLYDEAQRAREAADAANRSKSEFLANMSHEIRTPMNAILGLTQMVLDMSLDDLQRNYLQKVNTSSKALLGILNDILDYSKIEAGKLDLEEVEFDLEETLRHTAQLFSVGAEEKEIELVFEIDRDVPQVLMGDPLRLGQIFNNLVGNAIKFTEHGEVHIKAQLDRMEGDKAWLQFSVRDTGIGITKEQKDHLFQAFSQADTSTTRKFGGTGLGLTISKRLVEMMGGSITVESMTGVGSTFLFTVPLRPGHKDGLAHSSAQLYKMKTLVIDDQLASLQVMRNLLGFWSFDVTLAASGEDGLQAIQKAAQAGRPFELLLVDWKMHGLDGLELARRIRELGETREQPPLVVMVTAFNREDVMRSAEAVHLDGVLEKPVSLSPLFDLLIGLQKGKTRQLPQNPRLKLFERTMSLHGAHILLVEDNPTNQLVARGILEKMALVVDIANDGREAVDKITSNPYDLVLMDLQMPEMDGFEATRRVRSMPGYQNLPIIAMTAAVMQKDREDSHNAGMNAHIAKPIDLEELISVLMTWVPQQRAFTEGAEPAPPSATNHTLLKSTKDFDLDVTLSWLGGDPALLKKILTSFQLDLEKTRDKLHDAIREQNWPTVKSIAHKLNGTAGNMGAVTLQQHAAALEAELMEKSTAETSTLEESILQTLELCKGFLEEMANGSAANESAGREEIGQVFAELGDLLTNNRLVPTSLLDKIQAARALGVRGELLEKLGQEAGMFQYKEALLTLRLIQKELESKS